MRFITKTRFEIIDQDIEGPNNEDMKALKQLQVADRFNGKYSLEELGVKLFWITLRKK